MDKIVKRLTAILIFLSKVKHEPQVGSHHLVARLSVGCHRSTILDARFDCHDDMGVCQIEKEFAIESQGNEGVSSFAPCMTLLSRIDRNGSQPIECIRESGITHWWPWFC
ncbi:hypothetical protein WK57_00020 [Burkholderia ubonensis]|uniref:Uncharacterized protein n=1 Tax=Burkholderia ubonensis TaxID=101571 RepID=A0AA40R998_9BURK|nr:hypothetical protein WK57_00020 [Burkholderia ubonensis]